MTCSIKESKERREGPLTMHLRGGEVKQQAGELASGILLFSTLISPLPRGKWRRQAEAPTENNLNQPPQKQIMPVSFKTFLKI